MRIWTGVSFVLTFPVFLVVVVADASAVDVDSWDLAVTARQPIPSSSGVTQSDVCSPCVPSVLMLSRTELDASSSADYDVQWSFSGADFQSVGNLDLSSVVDASLARTDNAILFVPDVDSRYEISAVLDVTGVKRAILQVRLVRDPNSAIPVTIYRFDRQTVNVPNETITLEGPGTIQGTPVGTLTAGALYGVSWTMIIEEAGVGAPTAASAATDLVVKVNPLVPLPAMSAVGKLALVASLLVACLCSFWVAQTSLRPSA